MLSSGVVLGLGVCVLLNLVLFQTHPERLVKNTVGFAIAFALDPLFQLIGGKKLEMTPLATVAAALKFARKHLAGFHTRRRVADHDVQGMMFPARNIFRCFHATWIENILAVRIDLFLYAHVSADEWNVGVKQETTAVV